MLFLSDKINTVINYEIMKVDLANKELFAIKMGFEFKCQLNSRTVLRSIY